MTSIEFLAALSPVAQNMMSIYQFKEEKPIELHITDNKERPCFMVYDNPDCYPVYLNPDVLGVQSERQFMHQFCHCVQIEEKFPFVKSKTPEDKETVELAEAVNSIVLDMYANHVLKSNGYPKDEKALEALYTELHFRFRYFTENKMPITAHDKKYAEYIYASQIAKIYFEYETKKARALQKEVAVFSKATKMYAGMFINIIKAYAYDTNIGCHYIFDHLLDELKLTDILEIDHREEEEEEEAATAKETETPDNVVPFEKSAE